MQLKPSILKNFSSNLVFYIAKLLVGIIAMPVCLYAFGQESYGLYLLGFGLSASLSAFDLGASKSVFRYAVEFHQDNDAQKYQSALNGAFSLTLLAAICIAAVLYIVGIFGTELFNLSQAVAPACIPVFTIAAINALLITADGAPQQLLQAHHNFHLRNTWQYIPLTGNIILLIVVHLYSMTLVQFAIYSTLITATMVMIDIILIWRLKILKGFHFMFQLKQSPSSAFSNRSFIHAGISFLSVQADRLIIGSILDVSAVTTYTIITKPYFIIRGLIASGYPAFQPGLTGFYLKGDMQAFIAYSSRIIRGTFLTMVCMSAFITAFFYPLLDLWLGTHMYHDYVGWGMVSLGIACLTMIYTPYYRTMIYSDEVNSVLRFSYISVPLNVLISIYLTGQFGFYGVILGTLCQIVAEGIYITYTMRKKTGSGWINIPVRHLIITVIMVASALLISAGLRNAFVFETKTMLLMIGYAAVCLGITAYIVRSTKLFTPIQSNFPG